MRALIIYESLTGNTRLVASSIAERLRSSGVDAVTCPVKRLDHAALSRADVVFVGTWTDGVFVVGQRPARAERFRRLPAMAGKRCVLFCTYALDPGRTLDKLSAILSERGATVLGGLAIRRDKVEEGVAELVERALELVGD